MRSRWVGFLFVLILALPLGALAAEKVYESGKVVDVQQKTNTRVLYYISNTPVTKDEPYYEVSVQTKAVLYLGKYTPRNADETLPVDWQPGAAVDVRADNHHLFIRKYSGVDVEFAIVKRTSIMKVGPTDASPAPDGK